MFCPRCGKGLATNAAFCMHCGQALQAVATTQPSAAGPREGVRPAPVTVDNSDKKKRLWWWLGGGLAALLALFAGLWALLAAMDKPVAPTLQAQGTRPAPVTPVVAPPTAPVLPATKATMPVDVRAWLEHLEKIEKRKNELSMRQTSEMLVYMTQLQVGGGMVEMLTGDPDAEAVSPATKTQKTFNDLKPEWGQLITDFNSLPPPAECQEIATHYYKALNGIPSMTSDLAQILQGATTNPQEALAKVGSMENKSRTEVDQPLKKTDEGVGAICAKYDTKKWFDIQSDVGTGLLGAGKLGP